MKPLKFVKRISRSVLHHPKRPNASREQAEYGRKKPRGARTRGFLSWEENRADESSRFNPFRRASDSALVAFVPLVRRLVISPDSFEPANEARLGRFHKSSHGSLLYVLISSSIALEREAVCDRGHRASRLATMVKPVVAPKIIQANHSGIGSMPSGAGRL